MTRRWVPALVLGGLWWWAVLRLVLEPEHAGVIEGAVAAGGWGLSLLPVHVTASARPAGAGRRSAGAREGTGSRSAGAREGTGSGSAGAREGTGEGGVGDVEP
ncbi:hypothetical protein OG230_26390 [Streptomyces sp. NBC_00234]|uniref:hypothetical protein n=1 Tax=Streptomyces sp. NBC_00234 TaxID=2903638 RepID=UPI002E2D1FAF|nr:hypothetical protein [Streptomyces sp. NBC_00234]